MAAQHPPPHAAPVSGIPRHRTLSRTSHHLPQRKANSHMSAWTSPDASSVSGSTSSTMPTSARDSYIDPNSKSNTMVPTTLAHASPVERTFASDSEDDRSPRSLSSPLSPSIHQTLATPFPPAHAAARAHQSQHSQLVQPNYPSRTPRTPMLRTPSSSSKSSSQASFVGQQGPDSFGPSGVIRDDDGRGHDWGLAFRPEEVEAITRSHSRGNGGNSSANMASSTATVVGTHSGHLRSSSRKANRESAAQWLDQSFSPQNWQQPPQLPLPQHQLLQQHPQQPSLSQLGGGPDASTLINPRDRERDMARVQHNGTARPSRHAHDNSQLPAAAFVSEVHVGPESLPPSRPPSFPSSRSSSYAGSSHTSSTSSSRRLPRGESPPFSPTTPAPVAPPPAGVKTMPEILKSGGSCSSPSSSSTSSVRSGNERVMPQPGKHQLAERDDVRSAPPLVNDRLVNDRPSLLHRQESTLGGAGAPSAAMTNSLIPPRPLRSQSSPGPKPCPVSVVPTLRRPSQAGAQKDLEAVERDEWARKTGRSDVLSMRVRESGVSGEGGRDRWGNRWGMEGHVLSPVISERTEPSGLSDSGLSSMTSLSAVTSRSRHSVVSNNTLLKRLHHSNLDAAMRTGPPAPNVVQGGADDTSRSIFNSPGGTSRPTHLNSRRSSSPQVFGGSSVVSSTPSLEKKEAKRLAAAAGAPQGSIVNIPGRWPESPTTSIARTPLHTPNAMGSTQDSTGFPVWGSHDDAASMHGSGVVTPQPRRGSTSSSAGKKSGHSQHSHISSTGSSVDMSLMSRMEQMSRPSTTTGCQEGTPAAYAETHHSIISFPSLSAVGAGGPQSMMNSADDLSATVKPDEFGNGTTRDDSRPQNDQEQQGHQHQHQLQVSIAMAKAARREEKKARMKARSRRANDAEKRDAEIADRQAVKRQERERREKMLAERDAILLQLADKPSDPRLVRDLGKLYLMNGGGEPTLKLAIRYLEQSIQTDNRDAQAWLYLAKSWSLLLAFTAPAQAEQDQRASNASIGFRKAIGISSQGNKVEGNPYRLAYAEYLDEQGRYKEAAAIVQEAIEVDSTDPETWWELGRIMERWAIKGDGTNKERLMRQQNAVKAYEAACAIEPSDDILRDGWEEGNRILVHMQSQITPSTPTPVPSLPHRSISGSSSVQVIESLERVNGAIVASAGGLSARGSDNGTGLLLGGNRDVTEHSRAVSPSVGSSSVTTTKETHVVSPNLVGAVMGSISTPPIPSPRQKKPGQRQRPPSPSKMSPPGSGAYRPPSPSSLPAPVATPRVMSPLVFANLPPPPAVPPRPPSRGFPVSGFSSNSSSPSRQSPVTQFHTNKFPIAATPSIERVPSMETSFVPEDPVDLTMFNTHLQSLVDIDEQRRAEISILRQQFHDTDQVADQRRATVIEQLRVLCATPQVVSPVGPVVRSPSRSQRPPSRARTVSQQREQLQQIHHQQAQQQQQQQVTSIAAASGGSGSSHQVRSPSRNTRHSRTVSSPPPTHRLPNVSIPSGVASPLHSPVSPSAVSPNYRQPFHQHHHTHSHHYTHNPQQHGHFSGIMPTSHSTVPNIPISSPTPGPPPQVGHIPILSSDVVGGIHQNTFYQQPNPQSRPMSSFPTTATQDPISILNANNNNRPFTPISSPPNDQAGYALHGIASILQLLSTTPAPQMPVQN